MVSMLDEVIFAGFGGQGILLAARILAEAAMMEDSHVAWVPSYGTEMRGGTASASVIISDDEIGSLIVAQPTAVVVMNSPSFRKCVPQVKEGGLVVYNCSLIDDEAGRKDVEIIDVPASEVAAEMGNIRLANMVMLGAFVGISGVVGVESLLTALEKMMHGPKAALLGANIDAIRWGLGVSRRASAVS